MTDIRLLSPDLINKIAAGEVVERPASIVKELIENAIDAKSHNITIKIERGGVNFIEISDDGIGMNEQNAKLAFVQHATSKIYSENDLQKILTLGFRGEALASISSIATTTIHTKTSTTDPILVLVRDGHIVSKPGSGRKTGTTVTVKDIFQKIPARKKFLKSENAEYKHILNTFIKITIPFHNINFNFYNNNKLVYSLKETKTIEQRIIQIFPILKSKLIPVFFSDKSINISGYIGHPSINRKDKSLQFVFVNSRAVSEPIITQAIKTGYGTNLMHNQVPVYFITINIDPKKIDVNVHPRKNELRFDNSQEIFRLIYNVVRESLEKHLQIELQNRLTNTASTPRQEYVPEYNTHTTKSIKTSSPYNFSPIPSNKPISYGKGLNFTKEILLQSQEYTSLIEPEPTIGDTLQIFNTYLLVERNGELMVLDQHAAAERITYEKIKARFQKHHSLPAQKLLIPESINISKQEYLNIIEHKKILSSIGFEFELKPNTLLLQAVPEIITTKNPQDYFNEILSHLSNSGVEIEKEEIRLLNYLISTIACHSSIRAGQKLGSFQMKTIINDLLKCKQPYSCPHGRPIIWIIKKGELEKNFKRKL